MQEWPMGAPPNPDWEKLRDNKLIPDDLPQTLGDQEAEEAGEPVFEIDWSELDLTDEQKALLLPVEARIRNVVYPSHAFTYKKKARGKGVIKNAGNKRKNKWGAKFLGVSTPARPKRSGGTR